MRAGLFLRLSVACVAPQTEEVYKRKHVYRTEVFQIQDHFIKEKRHVNQALVGHAAVAIMQSTAARVGCLQYVRRPYSCI